MTEHIRVIATGGTIDKVYHDALDDYAVGEPQVVPVFGAAGVGFDYVVESVLRKDSLELTDADRALIRERVLASPQRRIVVTHGTDTMVRTALALGDVGGRTVVFTGAMQPARMRTSDADFNLGLAVGAVQLAPPGVYVAMNGTVFPAAAVRKNRKARRFEAVPVDGPDPPH